MRSTYSTRVITIELSSEGGLPACRREATPSAIAGNAGWTWTTRYSSLSSSEAKLGEPARQWTGSRRRCSTAQMAATTSDAR